MKDIKVILKEPIKNVGNAGEVVEVSPGYARNFLIPKDKAILATKSNLQKTQRIKKKKEQEIEQVIERYEEILEDLEGVTITITAKAEEESGSLFGSIEAEKIAQALDEEGIEVEPQYISLPEPIKKTGEYEVPLSVANELEGSFSLVVEPEEQQD